MYKFIANKNTEKGMTQLLLQKRNKQFNTLFKKIRDPYSILQFYTALAKVYKTYFGDEDKSEVWLKVLMYVFDKGYFWKSDLTDKMGLTKEEIDSVLKKMGKRHLLITDKSRHMHLYSLSVDGTLFLKNFSRDAITEMMKVVRNGRTGNKKIFTTKKIKKKCQTPSRIDQQLVQNNGTS